MKLESTLLKLSSSVLLLAMSVAAVQAQSVSGRVTLEGANQPASYTSVYIPNTGRGTISDADGMYRLDSLPAGTCTLEFSYLGYRTAQYDLYIEPGKSVTHDVLMQEEPITLSPVYITPNGEDPVLYIFNQVNKQVEVNKKRLTHYDAYVETSVHAQDLDFIPVVLSKFLYWAMRTALKTVHLAELADFCFRNAKVDIRFNYRLVSDKGKTKTLDHKIVDAAPAINDKVEKELIRYTAIDPFTLVYGRPWEYHVKNAKKNPSQYRLVGTTEEQGHVIDIVEYKVGETDSLASKCTDYRAEDAWAVLRMERKNSSYSSRLECRDFGHGIFLPVSHLSIPSQYELDVKNEVKRMREESEKQGEKLSRMERSMLERMEEFARSGRKISPHMLFGYNIQYSNIQVNEK